MDDILYKRYTDILRRELIPAMGCTEPTAVAYAAALARRTLGALPDEMTVYASGNIIKNVKSVVVPHTGGMRGIEAAAAAGAVAGDADKELEVIADATEAQAAEIAKYMKRADIRVQPAQTDAAFDLTVHARHGGDEAVVRLTHKHTNIMLISLNGRALFERSEDCGAEKSDGDALNVEDIVAYADEADMDDIRGIITRQIEYNTAIAEEGLKGGYGAEIGRTLMLAYGDAVSNRAKAWAAAGSDARMGGCELPVIINSGSGNQGMTASLPVIVYARELGASEELLCRALVVSNLITAHLKTGIGCLSAYCGATSAGCGAGAGITYLYGGRYREIAHTIVNALAINSGLICDGAKASCAAKIASAVEAGLLGMQMFMHGSQFYGGDGIVTKGVENTINNVGVLAREGMAETDRKIIEIMLR